MNVWRCLVGAAVAGITAACGSEDRGLTQPTPPGAPPAAAFVHNTLNGPGNQSFLDLADSYPYSNLPGFSTLAPWAWDDFTSPETATIHAVSWQGGYCRRRDPDPADPPPAVSRSFDVWLYLDNNGRLPSFSGPQHRVTLTPAEAHEQFAFETGRGERDCAYYDYTAVLPTPLSVTAGTRYWLLIRAGDNGNMGISWGWRVGIRDNGISAYGTLKGGVFAASNDLAFSLASR
jgi:hypothetical protein